MEPLLLEPVIKERIWGREYWAASARPDGDCTVAGGKWKGSLLSQLWEEHRELFGDVQGEEFPLIVKVIDAREDLSIQVHPDDAYASRREGGARGKTECWYALDCPENEEIVVGHHARTREELCRLAREGRWDRLLRRTPVQAGDFFQIPAGCIHAICGGTKVLEIQENSDLTYRLYDYGRQRDGRPRPMQLDKALEVITVPFVPAQAPAQVEGEGQGAGGGLRLLADCPYYTVWEAQLRDGSQLGSQEAFRILSIVRGEGTVGGIPVQAGQTLLLPAGSGRLDVSGGMTGVLAAGGKRH